MSTRHNGPAASGKAATRIRVRYIFLTAFAIRLAVVLLVAHTKPSAWFYAQASELGAVAQSLVEGHGFSSPFPGTGPSAFLPPGYPLLVALLFRLFGVFSTAAALALMVLQAAFGAAAAAFITLAAERLFGRRTATLTGWLCALNPWLISLSVVFWDTGCSLMLLCVLIYTSVLLLESPTQHHAFLAAIAAATAILVNPALALTAVALLAWCAMRHRREARMFLLPALLFLVLSSLWPLRNLRVMHSLIPLRDNLGYELWQGNRPGADGFFAAELHPNVNLTELHRYQQLGELPYMLEKSALARQAIVADPPRFLALTVKRVLCFWFGIGRQFALNQLLIALPTTLLGFAGIVLFVRRRGLAFAAPLLIPLLLFPLPYSITHPDFRFWCLLAPLLTAAGVYALLPHAHDEAEPQLV